MIDGTFLRRLLTFSGGLLILAVAASLLAGDSGPVAGGLALGSALGMVPLASWSWIVHRGLATRRRRILAVLLLAAKLGFYGGTLYLLVFHETVNALGVLAGLTAVVLVASLGVLWVSRTRPREVA